MENAKSAASSLMSVPALSLTISSSALWQEIMISQIAWFSAVLATGTRQESERPRLRKLTGSNGAVAEYEGNRGFRVRVIQGSKGRGTRTGDR